ncbi:MAG: hypothetical protein ACERKV_12060 [Clostridiaceae bacterium]
MAIVTIPICENGCPTCSDGNYNFCGVDTVESEVCLVPAVTPEEITSVEVEIDKENFKIQLICCNLIVVCGFITKTIVITPADESDPYTKVKDIPVQIKVPAEICNEADLVIDEAWQITGVEVCTGCYTLVCPDGSTPIKYHKLVEKEIVGVQVDRIEPVEP